MSRRAPRFVRAVRAKTVGLCALMLLASAAAGAAESEPDSAAEAADRSTLQSVMRALAESGGVAARFEEARSLAILEAPIESSGRLYFAPPDWLARHVESPGESRVVVRDDSVSFRDETGVQRLELASSDVARAMVGNVMLLMRGDLESLEKRYHIDFQATGEGWTLELEPRDKLLRGIIERLRVEGRANRLVRMETRETSGDVTATRFSDVRLGVDFTREERERIFSVDAVSVEEGSAAAQETAGREAAR